MADKEAWIDCSQDGDEKPAWVRALVGEVHTEGPLRGYTPFKAPVDGGGWVEMLVPPFEDGRIRYVVP